MDRQAKLEQLCVEHEGLKLYKASASRYQANFTRDSITAAWLLNDSAMMRDQLIFNTRHEGTRLNPLDGQEPYKKHHELNLELGRGLSAEEVPLEAGLQNRPGVSTYNACDTTALWLIGHELLYRRTGSLELAIEQKSSIAGSVRYILSHLRDGVFTEYPPAGAEQFFLRVTYWKDSVLAGKEQATYPVVYPLVHAQNMAGLRAARTLLEKIDEHLAEEERDTLHEITPSVALMRTGLQRLYDEKNGCFFIAIDKDGYIEGVSSDSLYALAYLQRRDLPRGWVYNLEEASKALETSIGYRGLSPEFDGLWEDTYHTDKVWPVEQAKIHLGATRFGLRRAMEVSSRIIRKFEEERSSGADQELFSPGEKPDEWVPGGQRTQLWSIAAKEHFARAL